MIDAVYRDLALQLFDAAWRAGLTGEAALNRVLYQCHATGLHEFAGTLASRDTLVDLLQYAHTAASDAPAEEPSESESPKRTK